MTLPSISGPWQVEGDELATVIRGMLWNNTELLHDDYEGDNPVHPLYGHCYVASEAYHALSDRDTTPMYIAHEESGHWYLRDNDTGEYIDLTEEQFATPVPHGEGTGKGFPTPEGVSARTQKVLDAIVETDRNDWEVTV